MAWIRKILSARYRPLWHTKLYNMINCYIARHPPSFTTLTGALGCEGSGWYLVVSRRNILWSTLSFTKIDRSDSTVWQPSTVLIQLTVFSHHAAVHFMSWVHAWGIGFIQPFFITWASCYSLLWKPRVCLVGWPLPGLWSLPPWPALSTAVAKRDETSLQLFTVSLADGHMAVKCWDLLLWLRKSWGFCST